MCFPGAGALGTLGLGIASSMANFGASQASYAAQDARYEQNYTDALALNREQENALTTRQMQENQAFSQQDHMALVEGAQKKAQATVSAATGGVAGPVLTSVINGIGQQINDKQTTLETNWQNTVSQIQSQKIANVTEEQMHISDVQPPASPSIVPSLLNIGTSGAKAAASSSGQAGLSAAGLNVGAM